MAIQTGVLQFKGKIGPLVGRKVGSKYVIQEPGGFTTAEHKKKKRNFKRVRENNDEFAKVTHLAKAIYNAPDAIHSRTHRSGQAFNNLIKKTVALVRQFDTTNPRGKRRPLPEMLDFFINTSLNPLVDKTWIIEPTLQQSAPLEVTARFSPAENALDWPTGANACAYFFYTVELDFGSLSRTQTHFIHHDVTDIHAELQLTIPLFEGPCFILAGLEFRQVVNNKSFLFENRAHNPLYIAFTKTPS